MRRAVQAMMRRDLRTAFERVTWVGPAPTVPADTSVVLYANHHSFYDGYLLWLVAECLLGRRALTWMEDWQRFPFFAAVGALPFPPHDPKVRAATIRRNALQAHLNGDSSTSPRASCIHLKTAFSRSTNPC